MATRQQQNNIPLRKITDFKSKLSGGGARPNLFEVELAFPGAVGVDNDTLQRARFLVKAAALPASTVAPIDVPFRGRILKIAGDRTFETWTITVINDVDFSIRSAFEKWMNTINKMNDGTGLTDLRHIRQMHMFINLPVMEEFSDLITSMMYSQPTSQQLT